MAKGGNAVDAAVATGFALAVTFPTAGNLGGGGFMVIRMADGRALALDFRETAPRAATRDMYLDGSGQVVPGASTVGYRASGVPGSVAGLWEAHRRFGKLPWRDLVEPARKLAAEGFPVSHGLARELRDMERLFKQFPEAHRVFNRSGRHYEWGESLRQPELARTLARIRDRGPNDFYRGETARLIVADMKQGGGLITEQDLAEYQPVAREPLKGVYQDWEIWTMPPPSSGGAVLIQMLQVVEGFTLRKSGAGSSQTIHWMAEAMKRGFADRAAHFGDPAFTNIPLEILVSRDYAHKLWKSIDPDRATPAASIRPYGTPLREGDHTTHYSIVDREGNAVATTTTLNTGYGSGVVIKGAGFLMNNEMDDFTAKAGAPNAYGLIQGDANAIAPGKRPLSSMTPTIVTAGKRLYMVLGSPGGPTIINTVFQTLVNVMDHGMNVQQAVAAPRFHHQWQPDELRLERDGFPADVRTALASKGHKIATVRVMGSCHAILLPTRTGVLHVGVDPRVESSGAAGR